MNKTLKNIFIFFPIFPTVTFYTYQSTGRSFFEIFFYLFYTTWVELWNTDIMPHFFDDWCIKYQKVLCEYYSEPFDHFFNSFPLTAWDYVYFFLSVGIGVASWAGIVLILRPVSKKTDKKFLSGIKRLEPKEYIQLVNTMNKKNKRFQAGIKIHPEITLNKGTETEHLAIFGATGAAKTSAILQRIIRQAVGRGDKILILDVKGDFTEQFAGYKNTHVFAPWDARSVRWDIAKEIRKKTDIPMLARCFVPDEDGDKGNESFFVKQARTIFEGIIFALWSDGQFHWDNYVKFINNRELLSGREVDKQWIPGLLDRYDRCAPALRALKETGSGGQTQASETTLDENQKWLFDIPQAFKNPNFSISDWMEKKEGGLLILRLSDEFINLSFPLCVAMMELFISRVFLFPEQDNHFWLITDELSELPRVPSLPRALSRGRSQGLRTVICTQDQKQLQKRYGETTADSMLNNCSSQIWLRHNSKKTADIAAENLGFAEYEVLSTSDQYQKKELDTRQSGTGDSYSIKRENVIHSGELQSLTHSDHTATGGAEGFLKISGIPAVSKLFWPRIETSKKFPREILASWVNEAEKPRF